MALHKIHIEYLQPDPDAYELGLVTNKTYDDGTYYVYAYDDAGRLTSRKDAMGQTTQYEYDDSGQLTRIDYPDDTDIYQYYDNLGRMTQRTDSAGTFVWTYQGQSRKIATETVPRGFTLDYSYDDETGYRTSVSIDGLFSNEFIYAGGRLSRIESDIGTVTYGYLPGADLVTSITVGGNDLSVTRSYDNASRLTSIVHSANSVTSDYCRYTLNNLGLRTDKDDRNLSVSYNYDEKDQLEGAFTDSGRWIHDWYNYIYKYDEVGNRTYDSGETYPIATNLYNNLNQLVSKTNSGIFTILGSLPQYYFSINYTPGLHYNVYSDNYTGETVYVGGSPTTNFYVYADSGRTNPICLRIESYVNSTQTLTNYPDVNRSTAASVTYSYDSNGNLTNDNDRIFYWNDENRLVKIEDVNTQDGSQKLEFVYDGQGRRSNKKVYTYTNSAYQLTYETDFIYDGWNLVAEIISSTNQLISSSTNLYVHGLDIAEQSGSLSDPTRSPGAPAGGIGGLLAVTRHSTLDTENLYFCYDGNGNVTSLVDTNGNVTARYEYEPFGATYTMSGESAWDNPFRFSTKYQDKETGLYYYGYRYYSPELGRWLNRDPMGEMGGINIYSACLNNSLFWVDPFGLDNVSGGGQNQTGRVSFPSYPITDPEGKAGCKDATDDTMKDPLYYEYCGMICFDKKQCKIFRTGPVRGPRRSACIPSRAPCPSGTKTVGAYHSHTPHSNFGPPSDPDKDYAEHNKIPLYTGRGTGRIDRVNCDRSVTPLRFP